MTVESPTIPHGVPVLNRVPAVAGVAFAALTIAGDLTIGEFPRGDTSPDELVSYYQAHHTTVAIGGLLLTLAAVCFAVFASGMYARVRTSASVVAAALLIGAAVDTAAQAFSASTYQMLGQIGDEKGIAPQALQATHIWGSQFGSGIGVAVFMLAVVAASAISHTVPRWLAWPGLIIGLAQLTPVGFLASLLFLPWVAVAGVVLARRSRQPAAVITSDAPLNALA